MVSVTDLKETANELLNDMLSRIRALRENETFLRLSHENLTVFHSLINDLSVFYEGILILKVHQNIGESIYKLNNILDRIFVYYDNNIFLAFEIITVDLFELLLEMKGTLNQCIH